MPVYDEEKTRAPGEHDSLGKSQQERAKEIADLEALYNEPSAEKNDKSLAEQEANTPDDSLGAGYTGVGPAKDNKSKGLLSKFTSTRAKLLGFGAGAGIGGFVLIAFLFVASLGLPNLMENITTYAMAGVSRQANVSARRVVYESMGKMTLSQKAYQAFEKKYSTVRTKTWGRLDKYRPEKVAQNLTKSETLKPRYSTTYTGRRVLAGFEVNGNKIDIKPVEGVKRYIPGLKSVLELNNQANAYRALETELKATQGIGDRGVIMRSMALRELRASYGISTSGWALAKYKGLKPDAARVLEAKGLAEKVRTTKSIISTRSTIKAPRTAVISEAANEVEAAQAQVLQDDKAIERAIKSGEVPREVKEKLEVTTNRVDGIASKTLQWVSVYGIALPLCLIFDGSMINASTTIDKETSAQMQIYADLAAKADQQKDGVRIAGDTEALQTAIRASNKSIEDSAQSNAILRATGSPINTSDPSPQSNAMGTYDYSLINVMGDAVNLPAGATGLMNGVVEKTCSLLTNPAVIAGSVIASIVAAIFSGGSTAVAQTAVQSGVKVAVKTLVKGFIEKLISRRAIRLSLEEGAVKGLSRTQKALWTGRQGLYDMKDFGVKTVKSGAKIGAMTIAAKMIVARSAGVSTDGLAQKVDLANQADMGGILFANEASRTQYGGRALSRAELLQSVEDTKKYLAQEESKKPVFDRYFSFSNSRSLVSRVALATHGSLRGDMTRKLTERLQLALNPIPNSLAMAGDSSVVENAIAAEELNTIDYGIVRFDWSRAEYDKLENDPTYSSVMENERILYESGKVDEIKKLYAPCFSKETSLGTLLTNEGPVYVKRNKYGYVIPNEGICSPQELSFNNPKYGDLVFRWRITLSQETSLDQLEELQKGATDVQQESWFDACAQFKSKSCGVSYGV